MLKRKTIFILSFIIVLLSIATLSKEKTVKTKIAYAMGTSVSISIAEENVNMRIFPFAFNKFKQVEDIFKQNPDLNNNQVMKLFLYAKHLQNITDGVFSPYLGSVIKLWQFDKTNKTITNAPNNEEIAKALVEKELNLYAIAKGYGIDQIAKILKVNNINNFLINAGGDIYVSGTKFGKPWKIGVKDKENRNLLQISCSLDEYAVATSSNLYNYYTFNEQKYGHLLNGNTGMPSSGEKSITVISKTATSADGLATAVFVDPSLKEKLKDKTIEIIEISDEQKVSRTNNISDCIIEDFAI